MRKTALLIIALFAVTAIAFAQDQTVNGNLSLKGSLYLPWATDQDNKSPGLIGWPNDDFLFKGRYLNHYGLGFYTPDSTLRFYLSDYYGIDFFTGEKQRLTITNDGNVGIGTENPTEKLDVDGNVKVGLHSEIWSGYGKRLTLSGVGDYSDDMWLSKYCRGNNMTDLRVNIGDDPDGDPNRMDRFVIGTTTPYNSTNWLSHFTVESSGNVGIGTENPIAKLDVGDLSQNTLKSVLARLDEGNNVGDGTYLGVKSYSTHPVNEKSFAIEHKFYGEMNSSINFYRGGSQIGGSLGISVYDGREIARFFDWGLNLAGTIRAKEVKIEATGWADFVFDKNYDLPKLSDVEKHINDNRHLPGIPSEKEVLENGVNVVDMQAKLLQKIEELTLYVIDLKKENEGLQKRVQQLEEK